MLLVQAGMGLGGLVLSRLFFIVMIVEDQSDTR